MFYGFFLFQRLNVMSPHDTEASYHPDHDPEKLPSTFWQHVHFNLRNALYFAGMTSLSSTTST